MTAATVSAELHRAGVRLSLHGDALRVEAKPGALSADLRQWLAAAKPELVARLQSDLRTRLRRLGEVEGVPAAMVNALPGADVAACNGLPDDTLRAYLRALQRGAIMDAGTVPEGYTQAVHCGGCGPVWLWQGSPARVIACPWCFRRKAGRTVPQPPSGPSSALQVSPPNARAREAQAAQKEAP